MQIKSHVATVLVVLSLGCGFSPAGPHQDELQGSWMLEAIDGDPSRAAASGCAGAEVGRLILSSQSATGPPLYRWQVCTTEFLLSDSGHWTERNFVIQFESDARVGLDRYAALAQRSDGFFRLEIAAKGHALRFRREQP